MTYFMLNGNTLWSALHVTATLSLMGLQGELAQKHLLMRQKLNMSQSYNLGVDLYAADGNKNLADALIMSISNACF